MVTEQLINPRSIVIVGASNDITKPGGKVVKNILDGNFKGSLYAVNPKEETIQGIKSYHTVHELPQTDLAIIAIAAKYCLETVQTLAHEKQTRAFIILSAGFAEESPEGAKLEKEILKVINEVNGSLIGPNCIGVLNNNYNGIFTLPIPKLDTRGVDFITGSGATAVFIIESGMPKGLTFSSIYSVGNSAQMGVEEILAWLDESFDPATSSRVKILYLESIKKPDLLLKHAASLIRKGCRIAAIKSGSSDAGSRAASSHTGALASSDVAVDALFRKAGIVRCFGREELVTVACIFMHPVLTGKNMAIITHAGGPAVMLTDTLSNGGLEIPHLESPELLAKLFSGSSVANPIDFLATGTAAQLGEIIDHVDKKQDAIDGMAVIFGSPGLFKVYDVYKTLDEKMKTARKPIFPILPSVVNVKDEIDYFISLGRLYFPEEVIFGNALSKVFSTPAPQPPDIPETGIDHTAIRQVIDNAGDGYITPSEIQRLLDAAGIPRAKEAVVNNVHDAVIQAEAIAFPIVMKVVGPIHKSDVGGVALNIRDAETVEKEFNRMMKIKDATAVLLQPMLKGTELFAGAKYESGFGHLILCGIGGIFIEVLKDISAGLVPIGYDEAQQMLRRLKSYKIIQGVRGQQGVSEEKFIQIICRLSALLRAAPEIIELDLNPLLGQGEMLVAVDARICIKKYNNGN